MTSHKTTAFAVMLCAVLSETPLIGSAFAAYETVPEDTATTPGDPGDRAAIEGVLQDFCETWNHDDAEAFAQLFGPDGEFVTPRGSVARSRDEIRRMITQDHEGIFLGTMLSETISAIRFPQSGVAEVTGSYVLCCVDVFLGFRSSPEGSFTIQLMHEGDRWVIQSARIAEPE